MPSRPMLQATRNKTSPISPCSAVLQLLNDSGHHQKQVGVPGLLPRCGQQRVRLATVLLVSGFLLAESSYLRSWRPVIDIVEQLRRDAAGSPSSRVQPVAHDDLHHLTLELIGHFSAGQIKLSCEHALRLVFVRPDHQAEDAPQHLVIGDPTWRRGGATACQIVVPEYRPYGWFNSDHVIFGRTSSRRRATISSAGAEVARSAR
jgi:hypothetical protein